ncbi:hypothetical protein C7448_103276 [Tenacibaculum gallaicum]|uniref:Uncharacterized protein n=1 Tax=Tenacibaculum gallaicum TaxID=561505 RepID=A0A3E0I1R8_9FLAO|nr:hypothetical protein [Tenacibaculum gallaicum]REH52541.1 hypothetical protein C7448_103276 [Tenacibaculum gallaicum]
MKYHKFNFYRSTYCEFEMQKINFFDDMKAHFQSKSGSYYYYTEDGVFRYSNHWGRVANCRWKIKGIEDYKNQKYYVGYANWSSFYPLNSIDKVFYLEVDYTKAKASIKRVQEGLENNHFLMNSELVHQRLKQIQTLFKEYKWARYYEEDIDVLRKKIINKLVITNKTLQQVKLEL